MNQDIILQIKLNALKLDERLKIEVLKNKNLKLEKSIELLNDQLDRIYLDKCRRQILTSAFANFF